MTLIAEIALGPDNLPLVDIAKSLHTDEISLISSVLLGSGQAVFTINVDEQSESVFQSEIDRDELIEAVTLLGRSTDGLLYQLRLRDLPSVFDPCDPDEFPSTLLAATISSEGWFERKVFADSEAFERLKDRCDESKVPLKVLTISSTDPEAAIRATDSVFSQLTQRQRRGIALAFSRGYYKSPRRVSTAELGNELGISAASVSGLLRRAEQRLIGHAVEQGTYTTLTS